MFKKGMKPFKKVEAKEPKAGEKKESKMPLKKKALVEKKEMKPKKSFPMFKKK